MNGSKQLATKAAGTLTWDSPHLGTWQLRAGMASQSQVSEYEGGADYNNSDNNFVGDLRWQATAWANTLTLGIDGNIERMASQSHLLLPSPWNHS